MRSKQFGQNCNICNNREHNRAFSYFLHLQLETKAVVRATKENGFQLKCHF